MVRGNGRPAGDKHLAVGTGHTDLPCPQGKKARHSVSHFLPLQNLTDVFNAEHQEHKAHKAFVI